MKFSAVQRILGLLMMSSSVTMLPPIAVSLYFLDGEHWNFSAALVITIILGMVMWAPARNEHRELRTRDGFLLVTLFWTVLSVVNTLPFKLSLDISLADAVFEAMSGFTTTGATVLVGLDELPRSILYYRQQLQWLGGMGIIVLAVAILPMLGVGGMQLYRAETPGPMKDTKLTPRITETAKALWYLYLGLTIACATAYWLAGMTPFDAIGHSFSTIAIGGFSTHDASMGYFNNTLIEVIAVVFMLLAGMNFALHYTAWRRLSLRVYIADYEARFYLGLMLVLAAVTVAYLMLTEHFPDLFDAMHHGIFQVVSIGTTTGFTTSGYHTWPGFLPVLLLFSSFVGGCAGSTAGGMKVIRFLMLIKQWAREITRLVHPSAQLAVKIGGKPVSDRVIEAVWGFFAAYVALFTVMLLILMATGLDQVTAFSAVAACINNLGPGLGDVSAHYGDINDIAKWTLCFAMLLGRLEIFSLLVLLSPAFWRN